MPKRNRKTKRMRGGFDFGSLNPFGSSSGTDDSSSGIGSSMTGWWNKAKDAATGSSSTPSYDNSSSSTPSYDNSSSSTPSMGGRRRRRMRGGYSDNMSTTNLASRAGSYSGETARAQAYVGGRKTKRRCHKHKGSHRRHCRK